MNSKLTSEVAPELRLLIHPPADGAWNMSVDEMLMERAAEDGIAALRFYQWTPAVLSLGYFQAAIERDAHEPSRGCPLVRRASGGGAIVHDRELTYSISLPTAHPLAADAETLYRRVHSSLLQSLACFGVVARLNERALVQLGGEPFLCFQRRAVGDVLVGDHKICGSAQRRRRGAILQHGGILLARSAAAPELPGIAELTGADVSAEALAAAWTETWRNKIAPLRHDECSAGELARAEQIRREKYAADSWTIRR